MPSLLLGLAFFASVNFLATSYLAAQSDPDPPPASRISAWSATVDFGVEAAEPQKQGSNFARVPLDAKQLITITVQYEPALSGQSVIAEPLDGGQIIAPAEGLVVDKTGVLRFQFQAGENAGLCRISLHQKGEGDTLQFWVIDTKNPAANPTEFPEI